MPLSLLLPLFLLLSVVRGVATVRVIVWMLGMVVVGVATAMFPPISGRLPEVVSLNDVTHAPHKVRESDGESKSPTSLAEDVSNVTQDLNIAPAGFRITGHGAAAA